MICQGFIIFGHEADSIDAAAQFHRQRDSEISLPSGIRHVVAVEVDCGIEVRVLRPVMALAIPAPSGHGPCWALMSLTVKLMGRSIEYNRPFDTPREIPVGHKIGVARESFRMGQP